MNLRSLFSGPIGAWRASVLESREPLVRDHLNSVVGGMIPPLSAAVVCVCLISAGGAKMLGPRGVSFPDIAADMVVALLFGGLYAWSRIRRIQAKAAHPVCSVSAMIIAAAIALQMGLSRSTWPSTYAMLLLLCLGCILLSYGWWAVSILGCYLIWEVGVAISGDTLMGAHFRVNVYASVAISYAVLYIRQISYCRMVKLDLANRRQQVDLHEAIRRLEDSEERFSRFTNASSEGVIFVREGRIVDTNGVFLEMAGLERENVVGSLISTLFTIDDQPVRFEDFPLNEGGWRHVMEFVRSDGTRIPVEVYCRAMTLRADLFLAASVRDLTARRIRERQLADAHASEREARSKAEALAESANAASVAKSEFLANMSHEIRTPLNGVIGMTNMLCESGLKDTQMEFAEMIRRSAESLLVIVNDVLDFSQIEAGKLRTYLQPFRLQDEILHAVQPLSQMAQSKGVELEVIVHQPVPAEVIGDKTRICQIVTNLVGNAVKFTQEGSVEISLGATPGGDGKVDLRCEVGDTGVGIDAASRSKLFQSFSQADASTTRRFGGTGLGLAISRQLVELMNGEIGVESERGVGSTFWFTLPLKVGKVEPSAGSEPVECVVVLVNVNQATRRAITHYASELGADLLAVASTSEIADAVETRIGGFDGGLLVLTEAILAGDEAMRLRNDIESAFTAADVRIAIVADYLARTKLQERSGDAKLPTLPKPIEKRRLAQLLDFSKPLDDSDGSTVHAGLRGGHADAIAIHGIEGLSVLVAEDDEANRKIIGHKLAALNIKADFARDGRTAIEAFGLGGHDIVLVDSQMPGVDGGEAARSMREFQGRISFLDDPAQRPVCPVGIVAITVDEVAADSELSLQMDHRLAKPFRTSELKDLLERRLEQRIGFDRFVKNGSILSSAVVRDLRMLADGNEGIIREVLDSFIKVGRENLDAVADRLREADWKGVERAAHSLKGGCHNVGAEFLGDVAHRIEQAGSGADDTSVRFHLRVLRLHFDPCVELLEHELTDTGRIAR